jgi:hypothetical protein
MASPFLKYLTNGLLNPKGTLGDFQHAARLFTDNDFRLAPKVKFLFHVVFSINTNALKSLNFKYQHQNEINMLVKKADMPKFQITTEKLNQYNRKKVVQTKIDYQPINITFHDDNFGVVRQLWENYYSYYYADPTASKQYGAYNRTSMLGPSYVRTTYGLDNNSSIPFFDKITIYQMARHSWNSATLVNPIISAWNHDTMDYSASAPVENSMTLDYEAVYYDTGNVYQGNPPGFGIEHYDTVPSPLSLAGGGTRTLFGSGGVLAGIEAVSGNIASGRAFESPLDFISTAITAVNTYQNAKNLSKAGVTQEVTGIATKGLQTVATQGISGINNTSFPISNTATTTVATARNVTGGGP